MSILFLQTGNTQAAPMWFHWLEKLDVCLQGIPAFESNLQKKLASSVCSRPQFSRRIRSLVCRFACLIRFPTGAASVHQAGAFSSFRKHCPPLNAPHDRMSRYFLSNGSVFSRISSAICLQSRTGIPAFFPTVISS